MIDLADRQTLIDMAYNQEIYGPALPAMIEEQWVCPHCGFGHVNLGEIATHLAMRCDNGKSESRPARNPRDNDAP